MNFTGFEILLLKYLLTRTVMIANTKKSDLKFAVYKQTE